MAIKLEALVRNWWLMALRGGLAILFGLALLLWPDVTMSGIVLLFSAYVALDGGTVVAAATRASERLLDALPMKVQGLVSIGIGVIVLRWPFVSRRFLYVLVFWGIVTGLFEILAAAALPRQQTARWPLGTAGVSTLFLAVLILVLPRVGRERIAHLIAGYVLLFGVLVLLAAVRFRARAQLR